MFYSHPWQRMREWGAAFTIYIYICTQHAPHTKEDANEQFISQHLTDESREVAAKKNFETKKQLLSKNLTKLS